FQCQVQDVIDRKLPSAEYPFVSLHRAVRWNTTEESRPPASDSVVLEPPKPPPLPMTALPPHFALLADSGLEITGSLRNNELETGILRLFVDNLAIDSFHENGPFRLAVAPGKLTPG